MAGGKDAAVLFRKGEIVRTVRGDTELIVNELMDEVMKTARELSERKQ